MFEQRLKVKKVVCKAYDKCYITLDLNGIKDFNVIHSLYQELFGYLSLNNIKIVYEKIFGLLEYKEELCKKRSEYSDTYGTSVFPSSYIEAHPLKDTIVSSITVLGVNLKDSSAEIYYIKNPLCCDVVGTVLKQKSFGFLYLCGLNDSGFGFKNNYYNYKALFELIDRCIKSNGFRSDGIIRAWIYLKEINSNYQDLNNARREFFEQSGIEYGIESNNLPASTCIEGRGSNKSNCDIDLVCLSKEGKYPLIKRVYNSLQNEAEGDSYLHKPTFSRGMLVEDEDYIELQISGTASIDSTGNTVFLDDDYNQIKRTLINVGNLLEQFGMDYSDICQSTCFFKREEYYENYKRALNDLGIQDFGCTYVISNVCRDDLLFELDGIAMKGGLKHEQPS